MRFRQILDHLGDRFWGAYSGDNILALSINEVFTIEDVFASSGIAGEGHTGAGGLARVTEYHGLDVDCRSPLGWDAILGTIDFGAVIVPRVKDRID